MTDPELPPVSLERVPGTLFRALLDGLLILAPAAAEPLQFTSPGQMIWDLLAEPCTPDALAEELGEVFAAPIAVVRAGVDPVLRALLDVGAIRVADDAS